jgi:hypothetical protein
MKNLLKLPVLFVLLLLSEGLTSCVASAPAAVAVRPYPPRPVYYQPRPAVVVVEPARVVRRRPVVVVPARPRYYNVRPHRYVRVR